MPKYSFAILLAAGGAAPALAQPSSEWLAHDPVAGLVVAHRVSNERGMIVERIPPGETVERWSRMVTTQRFGGVIARGGTLEEWHGNFMAGLEGGCPGYRASAPGRFEIEGQAGIEFRVDCPRNPATGLPESFFLRAIAGTSDLHIAQVAFRRVPGAADESFARRHLASVTLCRRDIPTPLCRAGPAAQDR